MPRSQGKAAAGGARGRNDRPPPPRGIVLAALAAIPSDIDRERWVEVGMALKSHFGADGLAVFDEWSSRGETYSRRAVRDVWRGFKEGGGVTIGTLLALAKDHGFDLAAAYKREQQGGAVPVDAAAQARAAEAARAAREAADAKAAEERAHEQAEARRRMAERWSRATTEGASPYLARKGVTAHGCRFEPDGTLLVPMRDVEGELWNVQAIAGDGTKRFAPGGRVKGLCCWIGEPQAAPFALLAEGFATGATLHQASGVPVLVAFNAGNLAEVARAIAQRMPSTRWIVAADDDRGTEARGRGNPGRTAAERAAMVLGGTVLVPEGLPDGGTDFNDQAAAHGIDTVATLVRSAIAAAGDSTPESAARARAQRQRAHEGVEANMRERAEQAARDARRLWNDAHAELPAAVVDRLGVPAYGLRGAADGTVLVPMVDDAGELHNVQRIALDEAAAGGLALRFMPGARKAGLRHLCGTEPGLEDAVVIVATGYAAAAALHQATGHAVLAAFEPGNLRRVAEDVRARRPGARIVVAGEHGATALRAEAARAARAVAGVVVFPDGVPGEAGDFAALLRAAGVARVRELVEAGLAVLPPVAAEARAAVQRANGTKPDAAAAPPPAPPLNGAPHDRFVVQDAGVYYLDHDREGRPTAPLWVCSRLDVTARTVDEDGAGWGYLLDFDDPNGASRTWAMPARMLAGDGTEYRATLLNMGLRVAPGTKVRNLLTQYIQSRQPEETATCADRVGWHGEAFVLPRSTIQREPAEDGEPPRRIVFQTDGTSDNPYRARGTLDGWRTHVASSCVGNSRLAFVVSCAFAGAMLRPSGVDSGGFHLHGGSSCGKTTALRIAASVFGAPGYVQRWRTTDNALEALAVQFCDGLLILDELGQVDPRKAGECAYMLANESAKARSDRNSRARPRLTWRLLYLSTGEIRLAAHMAEGGQRARAGQELRLVDIPAEATPGSLFERTPGHENGATFAPAIARAAEAHFGHAGAAWLRWCVEQGPAVLRQRARTGVERLAAQWTPDKASGQVHRVARRFALVAIAGELATEAGITGWPKGEASRGARACFDAWLAARTGGAGDAEEAQIVEQVRRWLALHGDGRLTWWHRGTDDRAPDKGLRAGFRVMVRDGKTIGSTSENPGEFDEHGRITDMRGVEVHRLIFPDVFRSEVCEGFEPATVLRVLRSRGLLEIQEEGKFTVKRRAPGFGGKQVPFVLVKHEIFTATE